MARIKFSGKSEDESVGGGGGGGNYKAAPRGIYTLQVADYSEGQKTTAGKYPGTPITKFTCEITDEGEFFGKKVWHNVTWIPRGTGEKANGGHGMALHFLHAIGMPYDGNFEFEESEFQGRTFRALLEVATYDKEVNGRTFINEKNEVREIYTDTNPEPADLPPPPEAKTERKHGASATPKSAPAQQAELAEKEPW